MKRGKRQRMTGKKRRGGKFSRPFLCQFKNID
nr:MAG TPA: translation initiation factor-like protein [Herelleviridae sp. ctsMP6]